MHPRAPLLVFVLVLFGCGGSATTSEQAICDCPAPALVSHEHPHDHDPAPSSFVAGSRLSPIFRRAVDGTMTIVDNLFFDSELNTECSFKPTPAGSLVCLPVFAPMQGYFLDAACSQKVAVSSTCGPPPKHGQEKNGDACGSLDVGKVYVLDVEAAVSSVPLYWSSTNGCQIQPNALGATNVAIPILGELPPGSFVSAEHTSIAPD